MSKGIPDEFVPLFIHYRRDRAIRSVGVEGELLFLRSLAFARANRTEGRIEDFDIDNLGAGMADPEKVAATLVEWGLWLTEGTGWRIRSWVKWNPSTSSDDGAYGNHVRWHEKRGLVDPACTFCPQEPAEEDAYRPDESPRIGGDIAPMIAPMSGGIAEESRREEIREETPSPATPSTAVDAEFESWWQHYPRKVDKGHARTAYRTARKKTDSQSLLSGVQTFAEACRRNGTDPKFIAHASTWLSGERWADQAPTMRPRVVGGTEWEQ